MPDGPAAAPLRGNAGDVGGRAFSALFTVLDWIESGQVNASEQQIMNTRAGLILAGKQLAEELGERQ